MSPRALALAGAAAAGFAFATAEAARAAERARPAPGRFLTIGEVRVHLLDRGSGGPAVVLLHGNGSLVEDFAASGLVERLATRRRVVALDRPGFGRSTRPRGPAWTPEAQAALVAAAIRRLGLDRPVVAGHSLGALVALALALDHPGATRGLLLMGGYLFPTPRPDILPFVAGAIPGLGDVLRHTVTPHLGRMLAGPAIRRCFAPLPVPPRFARQFPLPLALRPSQLRAAEEDTAGLVPAAARLSARLDALRLPVTILAGAADRIVATEAHSVRLHWALPGSRLVVIPGAGHMVHHASPETAAAEAERLAA